MIDGFKYCISLILLFTPGQSLALWWKNENVNNSDNKPLFLISVIRNKHQKMVPSLAQHAQVKEQVWWYCFFFLIIVNKAHEKK